MLNSRSNSKPNVIAFMSGKGGVGKTMLAVATAHELSASTNTLLIDLDFFNRGLSALFTDAGQKTLVQPPEFLQRQEKSEWYATEIAENLYTIRFPDIKEPALSQLPDSEVGQLSEQLEQWLSEVSSATDCRAIVLDCHGGPDPLSFAAAMLADNILLVSEPDKITMYGTFHFLRRLHDVSVGTENIHLIFNKVVDSFSFRFLLSEYGTKMRKFFANKPLLAAFPLEVNLSKYFEQYPFVTEHFPKSMLARKVQIMLKDLLADDEAELLSERVRQVPRGIAYFWRRSFGRRPRLLQIDIVMAMSFIVLLAVIGVGIVEKFFRQDTMLMSVLPVVIVAVVMWAAFSSLLMWTRRLDEELTISSRKRN